MIEQRLIMSCVVLCEENQINPARFEFLHRDIEESIFWGHNQLQMFRFAATTE